MSWSRLLGDRYQCLKGGVSSFLSMGKSQPVSLESDTVLCSVVLWTSVFASHERDIPSFPGRTIGLLEVAVSDFSFNSITTDRCFISSNVYFLNRHIGGRDKNGGSQT